MTQVKDESTTIQSTPHIDVEDTIPPRAEQEVPASITSVEETSTIPINNKDTTQATEGVEKAQFNTIVNPFIKSIRDSMWLLTHAPEESSHCKKVYRIVHGNATMQSSGLDAIHMWYISRQAKHIVISNITLQMVTDIVAEISRSAYYVSIAVSCHDPDNAVLTLTNNSYMISFTTDESTYFESTDTKTHAKKTHPVLGVSGVVNQTVHTLPKSEQFNICVHNITSIQKNIDLWVQEVNKEFYSNSAVDVHFDSLLETSLKLAILYGNNVALRLTQMLGQVLVWIMIHQQRSHDASLELPVDCFGYLILLSTITTCGYSVLLDETHEYIMRHMQKVLNGDDENLLSFVVTHISNAESWCTTLSQETKKSLIQELNIHNVQNYVDVFENLDVHEMDRVWMRTH